MAVASAVWYGGITLVGSLIGSNWQRILGILEGVNRTMGIITVLLIAAGGTWYWLGRRRRARERLWHATRDALDPAAPTFLLGTDIAEGSAREAAALLVLELAYADPVLTPADRELVADHLRERWGLSGGSPASDPPPEEERRTRFASMPIACVNVSAAPSVSSWWSGCGASRSATGPSGRRRIG
jgi:hypothetical protein